MIGAGTILPCVGDHLSFLFLSQSLFMHRNLSYMRHHNSRGRKKRLKSNSCYIYVHVYWYVDVVITDNTSR